MEQFRIAKPKPRKSSKPSKSWNERCIELAESIAVVQNIAMVACSECVGHNVVCYYSREQSVKCAECLRHQRNCDGTFSLEEFRKVHEERKSLERKSREKRREIARLRRALADLENEDSEAQDDLARLEEVSNRMLKREMIALGVLDDLPQNSDISVESDGVNWSEVPLNDTIDWSAVLSDTAQSK